MGIPLLPVKSSHLKYGLYKLGSKKVCTSEYLASYLPELQAAERLWSLVNKPIANRSFDQLKDLEGVLYRRSYCPFITAVFNSSYYLLSLMTSNSIFISPMLTDLIS
jgi:hypothetical protein